MTRKVIRSPGPSFWRLSNIIMDEAAFENTRLRSRLVSAAMRRTTPNEISRTSTEGLIIICKVSFSKAERQIPGEPISSEISQWHIGLLQTKIISEVRPPILVELITNFETSGIVRELLFKGPARFFGEIDGEIGPA